MHVKTINADEGRTDLGLRPVPAFSKPAMDIMILAGIQIICFLALARLEPQFFIVHLYEVLPFVTIVLLIAYRQQRLAYITGSLVSVGWLALAYAAGLLESAVQRLRIFESANAQAYLIAVLALITAIVAVLTPVLCRLHWLKESCKQKTPWRQFALAVGVVAAYYAILLHWFWDLIVEIH